MILKQLKIKVKIFQQAGQNECLFLAKIKKIYKFYFVKRSFVEMKNSVLFFAYLLSKVI